MNRKMIVYVIGRILMLEGVLMCLPLLVSFLYGEGMSTKLAFIGTMGILFVLGGILSLKRPENDAVYIRDGIVIVSASWILLSAFGGLPFFLSGEIPSFIDCFFETVSGFTTTGSSIVTDLNTLSHSIIFWRSFTHFVGGMGVLVLALAIFPKIHANSVHIMKAEVPGPTFGKMVSKLSETAKILYKIYVAMTAVLTLLLLLGGMNLFDALTHAFGTAGTGGFGIKNGSVAYYNSTYIDVVIGIGMLLFGINFNLYYLILIGRAREAFKSEELRWYLMIVVGAVGLIVWNISSSYDSLLRCLRDVFFSVSSVITTTGYTTADFNTWPVFSRTLLLLLMFIGACAGSTAGGLKVSRVVILFKTGIAEIKRVVSPDRMITSSVDGKPLEDRVERSVAVYLAVYCFVFWILVALTCLSVPDFLTGFSAVAATFNNIGPGLEVVGPTGSYAGLTDGTKLVLSFGMLAGRLEIFPMLALFSPALWKYK